MNNKIKIKTYRNVDLYYNEANGDIYFTFEGRERKVRYVFEAEKIIDEPQWEPISKNNEGYFVDGYIDKYIGLAKATRKNTKTGRPDWKIKGQYDIEYKTPSYSKSDEKIYLKNEHNDQVYKDWEKQREVYHTELRKLNSITTKLK